MMAAHIAGLSLDTLRITAKTEWHMLRIIDGDGRIGHGEATLNGESGTLRSVARSRFPDLIGRPAQAAILATSGPPRTLAEAAILSALDMALLDLEAQAAGRPLHAHLSEPQDEPRGEPSAGPEDRTARREVRLYANINRRSEARTPASFAESALLAMGSGFDVFKLAPFDEVTVERCSSEPFASLMQPAFARIAAVREVIGPAGVLRIDCHWRFTGDVARYVIDRAADFAIDWVECPLPETPGTAGDIAALRRRAERRGIRLAGLENGIGAGAFRPFLEARAYDVIMPDVKYFGSLRALVAFGREVREAGASLSLHNPSGPVAHAASLHVAACLDENVHHEVQFAETPLFAEITSAPEAVALRGSVHPPDRVPGLGIALDNERIAQRSDPNHSFSIGAPTSPMR